MSSHMMCTGRDMWHVQLAHDMAMSSCCSSALDIVSGPLDMQLDFCYSMKLATNKACNTFYNAHDMFLKP
jgi:hypothetical protein